MFLKLMLTEDNYETSDNFWKIYIDIHDIYNG